MRRTIAIYTAHLFTIFLFGGITKLQAEIPPKSSIDLPPVSAWGKALEVDEPQSAFHSIGATMWHMGRNPTRIKSFHEWLKAKGINEESLLPKGLNAPIDARRMLIEPERASNCGWTATKDSITSRPGHRGPEAKLPLKVERTGMYRLWIRYQGHAKGTAVTSLTLFRKGEEAGAPLLYEEFNTKVAVQDGLAWHDLMTDLEAGEYTMVLGHVVRYYHTPTNVPFSEHKIDCLYLTDEIWADAPTDTTLAALRESTPGLQNNDRPTLSEKDKTKWLLWQVRPGHWETARENEPLFRLSYAFWREKISDIAEREDYNAAPKDPVKTNIPDYREGRRQVIFDPIWNMVGNPFRIKQQAAILKNDIDTDPSASDADFDWIYPGRFPVVAGQWIREGGGLSADHAATNATAIGRYTVSKPGKWHLWVQFKNINYFEYYSIHASTQTGQKASWERTERLYPGGRAAWAKVGALDIPEMTPEQVMVHRAKAAKGVFVKDGEPVFMNNFGEWNRDGNALTNKSPDTFLWATSGLLAKEDFQIRSRISLTEKPGAGCGFFFRDELGLRDNFLDFDGTIIGPSIEPGAKNSMMAHILPNEPFDLEITKKASALSIRINGKEAGNANLVDQPTRRFGFRTGKNTLHIHAFSATGKLDDGIQMQREINIAILINKYINPRTYRGVYRLFITNDGNYKPEGNITPKPSLARYESQMQAAGGTKETGYVMNLAAGIGTISQTWMPGPEPAQPKLAMTMAQDTTQSASLFFRNVLNEPLVLRISPGSLKSEQQSFENRIRWRAVGFAPYGDGREEWTPFFLLRRPFLIIPPRSVAQAWLTFDSAGMPPANYSSTIRIEATDLSGKILFPTRTINTEVRVFGVRVEPRQPILVHGWVNPPPGEEYRTDWFKRFNVWQGPFFSKDEMAKYGIKQQIWCQRGINEKQIRGVVAEAKAKGLTHDDWMMSINDEPTGKTAKELADYLAIGKMIREIDPQLKITLNPGEAANAATFQILQPFADLWNPYKLHLSYGPSGRDYLKKPWIWYTTPCYQDKSPGIATEMYEQIRSVLRQPADCRGTAFFAPYYPWRDPWDTAYEHIKDVSVFVLPSRHGPVATPAWEAIRESVQHANLARMVRERAKPEDATAKPLWETGSVESLCNWLLAQP